MSTELSRDLRLGVYGVLGEDIQYTLSPVIFRHVFASLKWPAVYAVFDNPSSRLPKFARAALDAGIVGYNVTKPHKVAIIKHLKRLDISAKVVGAVNTVLCQKAGGVGYNTDVDGVEFALTPHRARLRGGNAIILGAGGAARAVAYALTRRIGMSGIALAVRNRRRAEPVARELQSRCGKAEFTIVGVKDLLESSLVGKAGLIVNATPLGSTTHRTQMPLSARIALSPQTIVFDLVYRPRLTRFLLRAQRAGCPIVNGWPMLVAQAEAAFRIWTGLAFPRRARKQLLDWDPDRR